MIRESAGRSDARTGMTVDVQDSIAEWRDSSLEQEPLVTSIISLALVLSAFAPASQGVGVEPACTAILPGADADLGKSDRIAQRIETAYARVRPSIVLVEGRDGENRHPQWRKTGVIVT